jgi:hypothetical protein
MPTLSPSEYSGIGGRVHKGLPIESKPLIVTAAEIAEDLAKLRPKSLAEAPFKLLDARAALLDEGRTAVGRELQYLFHIDNSFARRAVSG